MQFRDLDWWAGKDGERRVVHLTWNDEGTTYTAELVNVGGIPRVRRFIAEAEHGLPVAPRRIPTDAAILGALREAGPPAHGHWLFLTEDSLQLDGQVTSLWPAQMERLLAAFQRDLFRQPFSRRPELIDTAREMLGRDLRTTDIIQALVGAGVSESTAYRHLGVAKKRREREAAGTTSPRGPATSP